MSNNYAYLTPLLKTNIKSNICGPPEKCHNKINKVGNLNINYNQNYNRNARYVGRFSNTYPCTFISFS